MGVHECTWKYGPIPCHIWVYILISYIKIIDIIFYIVSDYDMSFSYRDMYRHIVI